MRAEGGTDFIAAPLSFSAFIPHPSAFILFFYAPANPLGGGSFPPAAPSATDAEKPVRPRRGANAVADVVVSLRASFDGHLSADDLRAFRIQFTRLRAVMPSGLEVQLPREAPNCPPSTSSRRSRQRHRRLHRVPGRAALDRFGRAKYASTATTAAIQPRQAHLQACNEVECADENTGENRKPLLVRRLNARILLEQRGPLQPRSAAALSRARARPPRKAPCRKI